MVRTRASWTRMTTQSRHPRCSRTPFVAERSSMASELALSITSPTGSRPTSRCVSWGLARTWGFWARATFRRSSHLAASDQHNRETPRQWSDCQRKTRRRSNPRVRAAIALPQTQSCSLRLRGAATHTGEAAAGELCSWLTRRNTRSFSFYSRSRFHHY